MLLARILKYNFIALLILFNFHFSVMANVVCMCITTPVTFLEVIDGDTIWVKKKGEKVLVQFEGIDAPELVNKDKKKSDCIDVRKKPKMPVT